MTRDPSEWGARGGQAVEPGGTVRLTSGGAMPLIGLGTWQLRGESAYRVVGEALKVGYRHIDTATMYHNEAEIGRALRDACDGGSSLRRSDVFVTTKLPPERADRPAPTLRASLDALGLDHVDLWLIHWPPSGKASPRTWEAFIAARADGLVKAIGVSNYSTAQVDELIAATGVAPDVNQVEWSPALHRPARLAELRDRGVVLEGYSPFKTTDLADPTLVKIAERYGVSVPQVVVRWHLQHGIVVIPKSARRERLVANREVGGFDLTAAELASIDVLGAAGRR